jgi:adenosine deaminase
MADCPVTMELVRQHQVHVEVCPTSSVETGGWVYSDGDDGDNDNDSPTSTKTKNWKEHPAVVMRRHGVSISLSSDDPAVFHTSLAWQYRVALAKMEFRHADLIQMNLDALDAAWCSSPTKERLRGLVLDYARRQRVKGFVVEEENAMTTSPSKTEEWKNPRHGWQRSITDSFSDRVYVFEDERW